MEMEFSVPYILLYLLLLLITALKLRPKPVRLPPGPFALPIIGNILSLSGDPHLAFARLAKLYGPLMTIKIGMLTTIVVSSQDAAKTVLQKHDAKLAGRWIPDAIQVNGFPGVSMIWNPPNQFWRQLRSICNSNLFSHRSLESSKPFRLEKVSSMIQHFRREAEHSVQFREVAFGAVLSLMSITLFSVDLNSSPESCKVVAELLDGLARDAGKANISDFFPVFRALDLQGRRKAMAVQFDKFFAIIDEIIDNRMNSSSSTASGDFLDCLLQLHAESKMDRKTIQVLFLDIIGAGLLSTTNTLEWAMAQLLNNPNMLSKLQAELDKVICCQGKEAMEECDIAKLPYLQAIVEETLRVHPPAPFFVPHKALEDVELENYNYLIPKGTQVLINIWAINRDEQVWSNPNDFQPERFLEREGEIPHIPFGSGRRMCPGMPLSLRMLHLTLGSLIHSLNWRLPDGLGPKDIDLKQSYATTLSMATPFQLVPMLRK